MILLYHYRSLPEYGSFQELSASNAADSALALGHHNFSVLQLPNADHKAQYERPGWVDTPTVFRSEQAPEATAASARFKQRLVCHELYIQKM